MLADKPVNQAMYQHPPSSGHKAIQENKSKDKYSYLSLFSLARKPAMKKAISGRNCI